MRQDWEPEDLIEVWPLLEEDQERLRNKSGANRLGFALLLKFFEVEARFPEDAGEIPVPAVSYVAQQVKVPAEEWAAYDWSGRAIKRHRVEIRGAFGFRECTAEDQVQLAEWLAAELCGVELNRDRLAEAVVVRCRGDRMEPPTPGRIARLVGSAVTTFEERFCTATLGRLSAATRSRLDDLVAEDAGEEESAGGGVSFFSELKADPGALGLDSLLAEVNKLQRVRALELAPELFGDVSEKLVAAWRARASKEYPLGPAGGSRAGALHAAGRAVPCAADGDHRLAGGAVHPAGAADQHAGGEEGRGRVHQGSQAGPWQGGDPAATGGGRGRGAGRHGLQGDLPGGRGVHAEGPGGGSRGERGPLPGPGAHGAAVVVLGALAADALPAAGGAGAEVQQHRLPAGDGRHRPAEAVPGPAHRQGGRVLRRGGENPAGRGGARGVAQGSGGRARPGRAHPVRAVRAGQPAGRAAAPGDLGPGRGPVAEPRGRLAPRTSRTTAMSTTTRSASRRTLGPSSGPFRSGCGRP